MRLRTWALLTTASTFLLMLVGAYVVKTGAGLSCPDWPQCNGEYLPPFPSPTDANGNDLYTQAQILSEWTHRLLAGITGVLTLAVVVVAARRYRDQGDIVTLAVGATGLLFAQIIMGAATVRLGNAPWTVVAHQGLAMAFFGFLVAILALSWRREAAVASSLRAAAESPAPEAGPPAAERRSRMQVVGDYIALTKPRVVMLLLVAAVTSMLIAVGPSISPWKIFATVLGGYMASGAGSAFNQWWERDLDIMMGRTAGRPYANGRLPASHVLAFSLSLGLGSFMVLAVFVNLLSAFLALGGALFYICVYTVWLKRITPQNIVIGGAAGSFPVLVGWAAATGEITMPALILGFIVFLWTPPHFWSLALVYKDDYARAGVPMLPVVRGERETKEQIFLYTLALVICTTVLWIMDVLSTGYLLVSLVLGAVFVFLAYDLMRHPGVAKSMRVFRYSILYLGILFLYMAVDTLWVRGHVL